MNVTDAFKTTFYFLLAESMVTEGRISWEIVWPESSHSWSTLHTLSGDIYMTAAFHDNSNMVSARTPDS